MRMWPLLVMVLLASIGQLLLKLSVSGRDPADGLGTFLCLSTNPYFLSGIFLYVLTTAGWMWALSEFPLSKAYPVLALSFVLVPVLAWVFLGEGLGARQVAGMVLIMIGVSLIGASV